MNLFIKKIIPDVVENYWEGSGNRNGKDGCNCPQERSGGLDVGGDHTEGNIFMELFCA